jgi:CxxC motif-containing protein
MKERRVTCIGCPMGCDITVAMEKGTVISVKGNRCKRGEVYARKEVTCPMRIVTSSVAVKGGDKLQLSVKTNKDIPKDKVKDCMKSLKEVTVQAPITIGDIILVNAGGCGATFVATKNVYKLEKGMRALNIDKNR